MSLNTFTYSESFTFENGQEINNLEIAFHTYGKLNPDKSNVIWVCHALTANADVLDWWKGLFGEHDLFNPKDHFIVCANIIGSHYGTTNPLSIDEKTGLPYYLSFPTFTIRDMAKAHQLLADHLEISQLQVLIGGSLGGQQALEWAVNQSIKIKNLIVVGTNAVHSPWGIAFNESQRLAISADRTFYANQPDAGRNGLKVARSIALLSYRTYNTYGATQLEENNEQPETFKAASYQNYQGEKLVKRFNAYSYWYLTKAMDSHNLGRGRHSIEETLRSINCPTMVIGVSTDILFPTEEQKFIAKYIPKSSYFEIESFYGHDGFLIETGILSKGIYNFLNKKTIIDEAYSS